jgi:predicted RecA/RadA family phage recombinase
MTPQAIFRYDEDQQKFSAPVALTSGDLVQLPDNRAGAIAGLEPRAIGDPTAAIVEGVFEVPKTANIAILRGGDVFFRRGTGLAHFSAGSDGFYVGKAAEDSVATATTVMVDFNTASRDRINLRDNLWKSTAVKTAGAPAATRSTVGKGYALTLDNTNEAQKVDAISVDTVRTVDGPIFEARLTVHDKGNNAALKINFGLANGTHASDFQSVTEQVAFNLAGNSLELNAQSKDGTTTVVVTDTTILLVADTYNEFWIDCRDLTNIKLYVDGVQVLASTTFKGDKATGPWSPILWVGKSANATTAEVDVDFIRVRTSD